MSNEIKQLFDELARVIYMLGEKVDDLEKQVSLLEKRVKEIE